MECHPIGIPSRDPSRPIEENLESTHAKAADLPSSPIRSGLLRPDVLSLLRHGSLHERYEKDECQSEHAEQPEDIEVGQ
jgi:hypothetical protein